MLGDFIYKGGPYDGFSTAATSSAGLLGNGPPYKLVFTVTPSAQKHFLAFERQPVVQVLDAYGNLCVNDSSTQVTITIGNNPGNASLYGTATQTAVNGVITYTDLRINRGGNLYTLVASAPGLISGTSATFDIFPSTGAKLAAVWNETNGYFIFYIWVEADNNRVTLIGADSASLTIFKQDGATTEATPTMTVDAASEWFKSSSWTPSSFTEGY